MIELFGGPEKFVEQLSEFVGRAEYDPFNALPNPYFWVGNEVRTDAPSIFKTLSITYFLRSCLITQVAWI